MVYNLLSLAVDGSIFITKKPYLDALEFCPLYTLDHFVNGEIDCIPMYSQQNRVAMQSRVQGVAVPHLGMYY